MGREVGYWYPSSTTKQLKLKDVQFDNIDWFRCCFHNKHKPNFCVLLTAAVGWSLPTKVPTADVFEHWIAERRLREYCLDKATTSKPAKF